MSAPTVEAITMGMQALVLDAPKKPETVSLLKPFIADLGLVEMKQKQILHCAILIYKVAKLALYDLQKGKLESFDALASDCACQVRAIQVVLIARKLAKVDLKGQLAVIEAAIKAMQNEACKLNDNAAVLIPMNAPQLDILVVKEVQLLAMTYLLSRIKLLGMEKHPHFACSDCGTIVTRLKEVTSYGKLGSIQAGLKPPTQVAVVEAAKKALTREGTAFLQSMGGIAALRLPTNLKVIGGKEELPCILSIQAMIQLALKNNVGILLKVRRAAHLCERSDDPYDVRLLYKNVGAESIQGIPKDVMSIIQEYDEFRPSDPDRESDQKKPLIVIEGQRCDQSIKDEATSVYVERLKRESLIDLLEMEASQHKQYSNGGAIEDVAFTSPIEAARLKAQQQRALIVGVCQQRQTLLSITHIYADTQQNQDAALNRLSGGKK